MLRVRWMVCILLVLACRPLAEAQAETAWRQGWLALLNRERALAGVPPLRLVPVLVQAAQEQAEEMSPGGWRIRRVSTGTVAERLRRVGYTAHDWREELVLLTEDPEAELQRWRQERSHAAFDERFRDLGIGAVLADGIPFYVFLFGIHEGDDFARRTAGLRDRAGIAAEMLARVNDLRWRAGLPPFVSSPVLDRVAQAHAEDMLARSYFGHRTPEGQGPSERALAAGYVSGIGENIVEQRFSIEEALEAWLGSPGHRRNILDPGCREMGLGLAIGAGYDAAPGGYRILWVQSFGRGD